MKGQRMAALGVGDTASDGDPATLWPGATEVACARHSDMVNMPDRRERARRGRTRARAAEPPADRDPRRQRPGPRMPQRRETA